jgi:hypothetical protein
MTGPSHHGSANPIDRELAAALHALAAPFLRGRVEQFIDVESRGIDFPALLKQPWSTTERAMIEVGCTPWRHLDIADARLSPSCTRWTTTLPARAARHAHPAGSRSAPPALAGTRRPGDRRE